MVYKRIKLQDLHLERKYKQLKVLSKTEYPKIIKFIEKCKTERDIAEETERKYIDAFNLFARILKKQICTLTQKDLEELKNGFKLGKITKQNGEPYSKTSLVSIFLILILYLEWVNFKKYSDVRKWFLIKTPMKTPEILLEDEIACVIASIKSKNKYKKNKKRPAKE